MVLTLTSLFSLTTVMLALRHYETLEQVVGVMLSGIGPGRASESQSMTHRVIKSDFADTILLSAVVRLYSIVLQTLGPTIICSI
jgi:hypothetical protein